jgi:AbrB family looped-hinge helix DNA binding protein
MDRAGRVVIPKSMREELQLKPGDSLKLEATGDQITLSPEQAQPRLVKEHGVWVHYSGSDQTMTAEMMDDMVQQDRLERDLANMGDFE